MPGRAAVAPVPGSAPLNLPSGAKRGIAVLLHGLDTVNNDPVEIPSPPDAGFAYDFIGMSNALLADGWATIYPAMVGDFFGPNTGIAQLTALVSDIGVDPAANGTHWLELVLAWWDHFVPYCRKEIGYNCPIFPIGFSNGAWTALEIAINRTSTIAAYAAHHPVMQWAPVLAEPGFGSHTVVTTAMNIGSSALNAVNLPAYLGWGTADTTVDPAHSGDTFTPALFAAALAAGMPVFPSADGMGRQNNPTTLAAVTSSGGTANLLSAPSGTFLVNDIGSTVTGTNISASPTTITAVNGPGSQATMSNNATAPGATTVSLSRTPAIHIFTVEDVTQIMNVVTAHVDPRCPAVF